MSDKWIKSDIQLPEKKGIYLVYDINGNIRTMFYENNKWTDGCDTCHEIYTDKDELQWRMLPEKPNPAAEQSIFNVVKDKMNLKSTIEQELSIQFEQVGAYYKANCPFEETKESNNKTFTLSDKQIFYCFSCHATGDIIAFIAKYKNMTQIEAVKYLIGKYAKQLGRGQ